MTKSSYRFYSLYYAWLHHNSNMFWAHLQRSIWCRQVMTATFSVTISLIWSMVSTAQLQPAAGDCHKYHQYKRWFIWWQGYSQDPSDTFQFCETVFLYNQKANCKLLQHCKATTQHKWHLLPICYSVQRKLGSCHAQHHASNITA